MTAQHILAIDQGTTSTRAILFDRTGKPLKQSQREHEQIYPQDGWVEHDPEEIWQATLKVMKTALQGVQHSHLAAVGITNQRETTLVWDRKTGKPIYNAIVWQDRRTAPLCAKLEQDGREPLITAKTGLLIDPYFSGTKLAWILDNVPYARIKANQGELAFGTIDSWLIYRLTGGRVHVTDSTNASRTMLYDIRRGRWDGEILDLLKIPQSLLPRVHDSAELLGGVDPSLLGAKIPISGVAGDQQAAVVGQACVKQGLMKSTYGTGCFALVNTGPTMAPSHSRLVTTIAYSQKGQRTYALEGSIFMAGATIQWLRDGLKLFAKSSGSAQLALKADPRSRVYLVPAFVGLGAPYWDPDARGAIVGLTRDTGHAEIARAGLESVCFQTRDLLEAMATDMSASGLGSPSALRVDGGMVVNDLFCQWLADLTGRPIERPEVVETTALGAAYLAGLGAGVYSSLDEVSEQWRCERRFLPKIGADERDARYAGWQEAVGRVLTKRDR
ncbi:MAG: glycerol kinase GlpK [Alphaproteobacteria bacterium]|nr:glycerol kinase GlpK [Alphaproteobacteria bacterium]